VAGWPALEPVRVQLWREWFLVDYFPNFMIFAIRSVSLLRYVSATLIFLYTFYAQHVETHISKEIASW
jgi:hypothetical protein